MAIKLEEICSDDYGPMICAGFMRIATFKNRKAFEASDFKTNVRGPFLATEYPDDDVYDSFEIWANDPMFHD